MSTEVKFENKEQVLNAIKDVRNDATDTDWAIIGHFEENPNKLAFVASGNDGYEGLSAMMDDTKCLYGFLRLTTKIDLSVATKFVYVHFLGEKIPLAKRGKFSVVHGDVVKYFQPFHVDFDITEKSEMSLKSITEKIEQAAGNANYVRTREFAVGKPEYGKNQNQKEATLAASKPNSQANLTKNSTGLGRSMTSVGKGFASGTKSGGAVLDQSMIDGIKDLRNDSTPTNWVLGSYDNNDIKSKIVLLGKGHGGSEEFNVFFKSDKFAYALVKVTDLIDGHKTIKFAMISWIGNDVSMASKAKVSTFKGSITEQFSPFHVELTVSELKEVNDKIIADKVSFASGSSNRLK